MIGGAAGFGVVLLLGLVLSAIGIYGIRFAYSHRHRNKLRDILAVRDQLVKAYLYEMLVTEQSGEILGAIEQAFSRADDELFPVMSAVLGEKPAATISRTLDQGTISA